MVLNKYTFNIHGAEDHVGSVKKKWQWHMRSWSNESLMAGTAM